MIAKCRVSRCKNFLNLNEVQGFLWYDSILVWPKHKNQLLDMISMHFRIINLFSNPSPLTTVFHLHGSVHLLHWLFKIVLVQQMNLQPSRRPSLWGVKILDTEHPVLSVSSGAVISSGQTRSHIQLEYISNKYSTNCLRYH